jgi:hypothetical protein
MGANFAIDETKCDASLAKIIKNLIIDINHHTATQADLDRYVFAYVCSCTQHPFLEICSWQQLVLDTQDVLNMRRCVDIGYCIRDIILKKPEQDVVTRVIQSSLPYLKHNRLNFPAFNTCTYSGMQDITRIVFGCCLGMFDEDSKKPPWSTRVYLMVCMHELLSRGSKRDLYVFCTTHMALVRIAAIECFVTFIDKYMPIELEHMPCLFSLDSNTTSMHFSDLRQVCNNFRTVSFDGAELNLSELNAKAVLMLERCNRICSHKIRSLARPTQSRITLSLVSKAINAPLSSDIIRHIIHPELDVSQLLALKDIQNLITRHPLVLELQELQMESLHQMSSENTVMAAKSLYCYVCFGCIDTFTQLDSKMRVHGASVVYCQNCNSHKHIIRINCLHSIVCIKDTKYFWCPICRVVHKWPASGYEMHKCDLQDTAEVRTKSFCVVCRKNTSLETFDLLDRKLGIIQTVSVCFKHRPWPHQMPYVYDISSFRDAVTAKNSNKVIY